MSNIPRRTRARHGGVAVACCAMVTLLTPQSRSTTRRVAFDVVSIKPNQSRDGTGGIRPEPGGRFVMVDAPIIRLIRVAYPSLVLRSQLLDAPSWVDSDRYDVEAKAGREATAAEMQTMLQILLENRLKWAAHVERRRQQAYNLVLARRDKRLGPDIHPATLNCVELVEERPASGLALPRRANGAPPCGLAYDGRRLISGGISIPQLIHAIAPLVGRVIIDKTGLRGYYEFSLEYAAVRGNASGVPDANDDRPSLAAALEEQLGLKLEPTRGPVEVLVIDHIERPSPN